MKKIIFLLTFIFSTSIFAANLQWYDLEIYNRYTLQKDIVFSDEIIFKAGSEFDILDFVAGGTPMAFFEMHYNGCHNPDQTAEMMVIELKHENNKTVKIVVELKVGCNLGVYVQLKDFFTESIFL